MEAKLKHLEFIQNIVKRMNANSFLIKGWCLTVVSAIFAITSKNQELILIPYFSIPIFWGLDAYFLSQEKCFREHYNHVADLEFNSINFSMDITQYKTFKNSWLKCLFSKTILPVYLTMIIIIILLMLIR